MGRTERIRLLVSDELLQRCRHDALFPDSFTDVISNVFKASHVAIFTRIFDSSNYAKRGHP